ncbi:methylamine utilization protein [Pleionea sediminis]|uniref:methylamine utilization protein n=1 Tax=Pleionea sediminis TaxID=2569479 RepID=UPI00197B7406|nr:methylamine utilization protein [Pleionea sediminis]
MTSLRTICLSLFFTGYLSLNFAEETHFKVIDQNGKPIINAVLELDIKSSDSTHQKNKKTHIIDQVNKAFKPKVVIINQGGKVDFPNSDNIRHHVYSFSPTKTFELKLYADKPKAPIEFPKSGVVILGCNIHDSMVGYIYVAKSNLHALTDEFGLAEFNTQLPFDNVRVWHALKATGPDSYNSYSLRKLEIQGNHYVITLSLQNPEPRNTFEDVFGQ